MKSFRNFFNFLSMRNEKPFFTRNLIAIKSDVKISKPPQSLLKTFLPSQKSAFFSKNFKTFNSRKIPKKIKRRESFLFVIAQAPSQLPPTTRNPINSGTYTIEQKKNLKLGSHLTFGVFSLSRRIFRSFSPSDVNRPI